MIGKDCPSFPNIGVMIIDRGLSGEEFSQFALLHQDRVLCYDSHRGQIDLM